MRRILRRFLLLAAVLVGGVLGGWSGAPAQPARSGGLVVKVEGLPAGERTLLSVRGPDGRWTRARADTLTLPSVTPGDYVIALGRHRISHGYRTIKRGALAFPSKKRLRVTVQAGAIAKVPAAYGTIVNPRVSKVPRGLLFIVGSPARPRELVFRDGRRAPRRGQILLGKPSATFPNGLVVQVRGTRRSGSRQIVRVRQTSISQAVPTFQYDGAGIKLEPSGAVEASSAKARASAGCTGPKDFDMGAKLDEFTLRRASAKAWPPQMSFQVALRTTERFGPRAIAAGVKCDWKLAELGPWQGWIPTPVGVPIPVYATIPVTASVNVEGSLSAFRINLASTSVFNVELGKYNNLGFWQEGTNAWVDGVAQISGKARAGVNMSLQMGVGSAKAGNLHVAAGFGPSVSWSAGAGCDVNLALGSLSAGVKIGWFKADTPPFSPFTKLLWHGCDGAPPVGGGGGPAPTTPPPTGGGGTPPPTGGGSTPPPPTGGGGTPTPAPQPQPQPLWNEQQGSLGANTFTNPYNASGMGPKIAAYQWVQVACKVYAPQIASANPDGYWYRIASAPWNQAYYAVANTFWNGDVPGQKPYTHNTDWAVPNC